MFESLKHWFDSLEKESKLFNDSEEEALHSALAAVLYHIISADKQVVSREKHRFASILKQSLHPSKACFVAGYHAPSGKYILPPIELRLMILPEF